VLAGTRIGRDTIGEAGAPPDAHRFGDLIRRDDFVGIGIDHDQRHLHRVQQVLLLTEGPRRPIRLALGSPAIGFEPRKEKREHHAEQGDRTGRERGSDAREERQQPGALGDVKRRDRAHLLDDGVGDG
jgi:hypothetical protein